MLSDEGLTLETSAFQTDLLWPGDNSTFINSFDKTKFSCFTLPPTQLHSFFRNSVEIRNSIHANASKSNVFFFFFLIFQPFAEPDVIPITDRAKPLTNASECFLESCNYCSLSSSIIRNCVCMSFKRDNTFPSNRCVDGWQGHNCTQCSPHPSCVHGTCSDREWECNCYPGWGGSLCDQGKSLSLCSSFEIRELKQCSSY